MERRFDFIIIMEEDLDKTPKEAKISDKEKDFENRSFPNSLQKNLERVEIEGKFYKSVQ